MQADHIISLCGTFGEIPLFVARNLYTHGACSSRALCDRIERIIFQQGQQHTQTNSSSSSSASSNNQNGNNKAKNSECLDCNDNSGMYSKSLFKIATMVVDPINPLKNIAQQRKVLRELIRQSLLVLTMNGIVIETEKDSESTFRFSMEGASVLLHHGSFVRIIDENFGPLTRWVFQIILMRGFGTIKQLTACVIDYWKENQKKVNLGPGYGESQQNLEQLDEKGLEEQVKTEIHRMISSGVLIFAYTAAERQRIEILSSKPNQSQILNEQSQKKRKLDKDRDDDEEDQEGSSQIRLDEFSILDISLKSQGLHVKHTDPINVEEENELNSIMSNKKRQRGEEEEDNNGDSEHKMNTENSSNHKEDGNDDDDDEEAQDAKEKKQTIADKIPIVNNGQWEASKSQKIEVVHPPLDKRTFVVHRSYFFRCTVLRWMSQFVASARYESSNKDLVIEIYHEVLARVMPMKFGEVFMFPEQTRAINTEDIFNFMKDELIKTRTLESAKELFVNALLAIPEPFISLWRDATSSLSAGTKSRGGGVSSYSFQFPFASIDIERCLHEIKLRDYFEFVRGQFGVGALRIINAIYRNGPMEEKDVFKIAGLDSKSVRKALNALFKAKMLSRSEISRRADYLPNKMLFLYKINIPEIDQALKFISHIQIRNIRLRLRLMLQDEGNMILTKTYESFFSTTHEYESRIANQVKEQQKNNKALSTTKDASIAAKRNYKKMQDALLRLQATEEMLCDPCLLYSGILQDKYICGKNLLAFGQNLEVFRQRSKPIISGSAASYAGRDLIPFDDDHAGRGLDYLGGLDESVEDETTRKIKEGSENGSIHSEDDDD